ncbi:unnamed protein product [Rangifer tarandus platyrhynchus]|uniref:Uncharacterized protein n=1 Tax=Rangifer tarandus platyrhynchus TaxID=3082113 RepID=A0AC59YWA9_RANTA
MGCLSCSLEFKPDILGSTYEATLPHDLHCVVAACISMPDLYQILDNHQKKKGINGTGQPRQRPSHLLLAHRPTCTTPQCPGHLSSHCRLLLHTLAPAHAVGIRVFTGNPRRVLGNGTTTRRRKARACVDFA